MNVQFFFLFSESIDWQQMCCEYVWDWKGVAGYSIDWWILSQLSPILLAFQTPSLFLSVSIIFFFVWHFPFSISQFVFINLRLISLFLMFYINYVIRFFSFFKYVSMYAGAYLLYILSVSPFQLGLIILLFLAISF